MGRTVREMIHVGGDGLTKLCRLGCFYAMFYPVMSCDNVLWQMGTCEMISISGAIGFNFHVQTTKSFIATNCGDKYNINESK